MKSRINIMIALLLLCISALILSSCKKYLDEKSNKKLVIPDNLPALQALLDNYSRINYTGGAAHEESCTDYYLTNDDYDALYAEFDQRQYTWQKDHLFDIGDNGNDWYYAYTAIYFSNSVLFQLDQIPRNPANQAAWDNIKGQALALRANRFQDAVQVWSQAYDSGSAATDLGIPLPLDPDFNKKSARASVQQTYARIIQDIQAAIPLLPVTPISILRQSKPAAYGLLARTYLWMREYEKAGLYADSCLQLRNKLLDYNTLDSTSTYPVKDLNTEVLFEKVSPYSDPLYNDVAKIDPLLYQSYVGNDLRRVIFFKDNGDGTFGFKGNYNGSGGLFTGITTDEMYLIRAESYARQNKTTEAMNDLNNLLSKRWKTGTFVNVAASTPQAALQIILQERRKELLMRGLRWMDIKRLNKEGAGILLTRTVKGQTYTLQPNDLRYAMQLPDDIISTSGIQQNP